MKHPTCHPDRQHQARGLCKPCYFTDYYQRNKTHRKSRERQRKYGLTTEEYEALLERQCGQCSICHAEPVAGQDDFAIDHDHTSGEVRGLLCMECNLLVGIIEKDLGRADRAMRYIGMRERVRKELSLPRESPLPTAVTGYPDHRVGRASTWR